MTSFDYIVILIITVSALIGLIRGFLREILSLIAYIAAFLMAIWWGPWVSGLITNLIENGLLRTITAYGATFIITLLLIGLLNMLLSALIDRTGLTPADHGLGGVFGAVRGVVLVLALVGMAGYTQLPEESWWQDARTSAAVVKGFQQVKLLLPESLAEMLPF